MRTLILALALILAALQGKLWFSAEGLRNVQHLDAQVRMRSAENRELMNRNAALEAEVLNLKNGLAAAEERARTDLGMVAEQETFFQIAPYRAQPPADR